MTDYDALLSQITRLCAEMIASGGAGGFIPEKMNRICCKYGIKESEFIVNTNSILSSAKSPDGEKLTAICSIKEIGQNFGKLNRLDEYCRLIMEKQPSAEEIEQNIRIIQNEKFISTKSEYLASICLGTGFAMLFGGTFHDVIVSVVACMLIVFIGSIIKRYSTNMFFHNAVVCLVVESAILVFTKYCGFCQHPESVSLGVIMLLISGLSFSDGLWFMINKEISLGLYKLNNAVLGAVGIVVGTATPLYLLKDVAIQGLTVNKPIIIQVMLCILACGGFAVLCCVEKKHVPVVALSAGLSWLVYSLSSKAIPSLFICMAIATMIETVYTVYVSSKLRMIPNITHSIGILPLVPGSNLFYMLYGVISQNEKLQVDNGLKMIITCLGISFGFTLGIILTSKKIAELRDN